MNIVKITTLTLLIISFASCKRDYAESPNKAPSNIAATKGFVCDTFYTTGNANFEIGAYPFFATFNETVSWKIELIGQISTATKTISSTSSSINSTNSGWNGNHDGVYYFEVGETVTANLIISGKPGITSSISFSIDEVKDATTATPTFMLANKYSDFETMGVFPDQFSIFNEGGIYQPIYKLQDEKIRAPQGLKYMRLEGVSTDANGFFVGGLQSRKNPSANSYFFPVAWTDPTKIYLNVFVRGMDNLPIGNKPYATLNFECQEDDNLNMSTMSNCTYFANKPGPPINTPDNFCPTSEDTWVFKIPVKHIGWQLFTCKYSDMLPSSDIINGGFGNKKLEPQKVARLQFGLISSPPFNHISVDMDYACFTYGAPLDPNK